MRFLFLSVILSSLTIKPCMSGTPPKPPSSSFGPPPIGIIEIPTILSMIHADLLLERVCDTFDCDFHDEDMRRVRDALEPMGPFIDGFIDLMRAREDYSYADWLHILALLQGKSEDVIIDALDLIENDDGDTNVFASIQALITAFSD